MNDLKIPKIRFAQYTDSWVLTPLSGLVASVDSGWSPQCDHGVAAEGEWGVLKTTSVQWTGFESDKNKKLPQALEPRENLSLREDDILVTRAGPNERVGVVSRVDRDYPKLMLSDKIIRLRTKTGTNPNYLALSLSLKKNNYQIMSKASGLATSQTNISQKFLLQTRLGIPTLPEQQKIASFLSKVDEKIGLLSEKKDKLAEYKRGVMQQLFNGKWHEQDGQLTFVPPTLRFKADDGSEFPDWEEKKVSDCFEFFTTNSLSRDKLSYTSGEVKNIHYGDIHTKFRTVFLVTQERVPSIAEAVDTKKIKAQSYCQDGDLAFADASEDYADIGKCIEIRGLGDIKLVSGLHTHLARPKEKFALGYQAYLQKSWKMRYQIMRIAQGTKVLGISTKQLAKIDVPIPCYDEQEKIASFMMSLDSKIELLNSELNKAKEWKRGLLQQMFV